MREPDFWTGKTSLARFVARFLSPLGRVYGASVALRARSARPSAVSAKVICIGNLTAGGTGKTPVAVAIAKSLLAHGLKPFFLTRGYGGSAKGPLLVDANRHSALDVGDEALLLARSAPVVVARDRKRGAECAARMGADAVVMDDGFQNFHLAKDLSLLVLDARNPFGNGHMIPAGPLREDPTRGIMRADALVVMGDGDPAFDAHGLPVLRARVLPSVDARFEGKRVLAFAGIGQPHRFFDTLLKLGANLADTRVFADHHVYSEREIEGLKRTAHASDAMLVTTEKDWVRLTPAQRSSVIFVAIQAVFDDAVALNRLLRPIVASRPAA